MEINLILETGKITRKSSTCRFGRCFGRSFSRRFGRRSADGRDSRPVVDPVDVVTDPCVNVGFVGVLTVDSAVAVPSGTNDEPLLFVLPEVGHRTSGTLLVNCHQT